MYGLAISAFFEALELSNRRDQRTRQQRGIPERRASCARDRQAPQAGTTDRGGKSSVETSPFRGSVGNTGRSRPGPPP